MPIEDRILPPLRRLLLTPDLNAAMAANPEDVREVGSSIYAVHGCVKEKAVGYAPLLAAALEVEVAVASTDVFSNLRNNADMFADLIIATTDDEPLQKKTIGILDKWVDIAEPRDLGSTVWQMLRVSPALPETSELEGIFCNTFARALKKYSVGYPQYADRLVQDVLKAEGSALDLTPSAAVLTIVRGLAAGIYHNYQPEYYPAPDALNSFRKFYLDERSEEAQVPETPRPRQGRKITLPNEIL